MAYPSLELEFELLQNFNQIIAVDEVGRGALAGPVAVGAAVFTKETSESIPLGLRDSKLISETKRDPIGLLARDWVEHRVGYGGVFEIEEFGITKALEKAAIAAILPLVRPGTVVLLDGSHNWLSESGLAVDYLVRVKADRDCASVSAAALIAKTERDELMRGLHEEFPIYDWQGNKGYASEKHIAAIREFGPVIHHRTSWLQKILGEQNQLF